MRLESSDIANGDRVVCWSSSTTVLTTKAYTFPGNLPRPTFACHHSVFSRMLCTSSTCPWRNVWMDKNGFIMKPVMTLFYYFLFLIIAYFLLTPALISFYWVCGNCQGNAEVGHSGVVMAINSYRLCMPMSNVILQLAMLLVPENQNRNRKRNNNNPTMSLVMMLPWRRWDGWI